MILNSLKDKTFRQFKIPVREVDHQDLWQRASIGFSLVGQEEGEVASLLEKMIRSLEGLTPGEILIKSHEILHFE